MGAKVDASGERFKCLIWFHVEQKIPGIRFHVKHL